MFSYTIPRCDEDEKWNITIISIGSKGTICEWILNYKKLSLYYITVVIKIKSFLDLRLQMDFYLSFKGTQHPYSRAVNFSLWSFVCLKPRILIEKWLSYNSEKRARFFF